MPRTDPGSRRTLRCLLVLSVVMWSACRDPLKREHRPGSEGTGSDGTGAEAAAAEDPFAAARESMVRDQIEARGVTDRRLLDALRRVPRHRFVPDNARHAAYDDYPLAIGHGQTISQPFVVAFMTEALELSGDETVLEVGTGSGYQAAILGELAARVFTIEIVPELAEGAREVLRDLDHANVEVRAGDGYVGWPEEAPFDAILVAAAPDHVPPILLEQLAVGGRMILPVGENVQELVLIRRTEGGLEQESVLPVRFVPMTGMAEDVERE